MNLQQQAALRANATARKVRARLGEGTRVVAVVGGMRGTVVRHIPMTNAQGGLLMVQWDNGYTGRASACDVRREDEATT